MDDRLRIFVIFPNTGGCAYYRSLMPMQKLQELFPHRVDIKFSDNPLGVDRKTGKSKYEGDTIPDEIKWADIVMINNISNFGGNYTARCMALARKAGKFVHFDTDDLLTDLYEEHRLINVYRDQGLSELTKSLYANAHLVTVTQKKFAERVKPYCKGILAIVKNSIDYNLPGWNQKKTEAKFTRIGWAGGIHHNPDVKIFSSVPHLVNQKVGRENVRWQFYGEPPPPKKGEKRDWQHKAWDFYRAEFFKGFKGQKNWVTYPALPPSDYGAYYAHIDVSLAPLKMNDFNDSKSEIKIAECGRYKIPLVASNVGCYDEIIVNGENGYLIEPGAPKTEWVKVLSKLIKDKNHRKELGENLHEITERMFDTNKVAHHRINIYEECFKALGYDPRSKRND